MCRDGLRNNLKMQYFSICNRNHNANHRTVIGDPQRWQPLRRMWGEGRRTSNERDREENVIITIRCHLQNDNVTVGTSEKASIRANVRVGTFMHVMSGTQRTRLGEWTNAKQYRDQPKMVNFIGKSRSKAPGCVLWQRRRQQDTLNTPFIGRWCRNCRTLLCFTRVHFMCVEPNRKAQSVLTCIVHPGSGREADGYIIQLNYLFTFSVSLRSN